MKDNTKGEKNASWKGGKTEDKGYIVIKTHDHPNRNKANYIQEHRLVAEKSLGRYLTKQELIHHINEILTDNRLENLYLFKNKGEHTKYHMTKNNKIKPITKSNLA